MWPRGETDVKTPGSIISFANIRHSQPWRPRQRAAPSVTRVSTGFSGPSVLFLSLLTVLTLACNLPPPRGVRSASEIAGLLFVCHACRPATGSGVGASPSCVFLSCFLLTLSCFLGVLLLTPSIFIFFLVSSYICVPCMSIPPLAITRLHVIITASSNVAPY